MFRKRKFNLQLFGEGGGDGTGSTAGAGTGSTTGSESGGTEGETVKYVSKRNGRSNPLENVIYGKASEDLASPQNGESTQSSEQTKQSFENLIKGEYRDDFQKRVQGIINDRFKDYGQLQNQVKSQNSILDTLAQKYGVQSGDMNALQKAIDDDESFYEQEAMEKGLSVEQLKELKALEKENAALREAQAKAEEQEQGQRIYSEWLKQSEDLVAKYGIQDFDLGRECENPDFIKLLTSGASLESAYKAIHLDDMISGAMFATSKAVKQGVAQNVASRNSRPRENGLSSTNAAQFKTNVSALTKADRAEIARRAARGDNITF